MARTVDLDTPLVVTGSAGFVGSALINTLRHQGYKAVTGIDISPSKTTDVEADYGDVGALGRSMPIGARVIHLGGVSTNAASKADPLGAVEANCTKTMKFAQFCAMAGCEQFVFASSEWVYGDPHHADEILEDSEHVRFLDNSSLYAQTKLATEGFLKTSNFFRNLTILRFAIVFGPRMTASSAPESILADCRANRLVKVGNATSARRFIFVDDLVAGILATLGFPGHETFNLPGSELLSLSEIYSVATRVSGHAPGISTNPGAAPSIRNISGEKAKRLLGWEAQRAFEECLRVI